MKCLFITVRKESPSARWRVLQFLSHFEKEGISCDVKEWPSGMMARLSAARRVDPYDVVVLQRRLLQKMMLNRLRQNARALVFEFDDMLTRKRTAEGGVADAPTLARRFRRTMRVVDAVVTTNEDLAREAERAGADPEKIHILPSVIDLERWRPGEARDASGRIVLGWVGSASNRSSVEMLREPLIHLCRRYPEVEVRIVSDEPIWLDDVRMTQQSYAAEREMEDVRSFDIALVPLVEGPWTRGRVSTRILSCFAAGLPVVASDVPTNRLYIRDGENGFLAGRLGEWEERIVNLIEHPELRAEVGARARESAERDYSMGAVIPRYLDLFRTLSASGRA